MKLQPWLRQAVYALGAAVCAIGAAHADETQGAPPKAALAIFTYTDSSGEPGDQTAAHAALLSAFNGKLRDDLAGSGAYRIVPLTCLPNCPPAETDATALAGEARRAGADYVMFGGIHKMSTLVQWARAMTVDVRTNKVVHDRLLTFRGDDSVAWQRAAAFIARELAKGRPEPEQSNH